MPPIRPQPPSNTEMFLQRIITITLCIAGALACAFYGMRHYRNYAHMGKQPEEITAAQAFAAPLDTTARWVRLIEPLHLKCDQALQQLSGGPVEFTEFLAYDVTGKYAFLLHYKGGTDCDGKRAVALEGVLRTAPMDWWTKNNMPSPTSIPVELRVGEKPIADLWEALCLLPIMMFAVVLAIFLIRGKRPDDQQLINKSFQAKVTAHVR
ncbi:MAG TPA: hypothetical protein VLK33_07400 [Terriglobales bacterium]|nr:hypothetical protein [Terriglobales bacterium]